MLVQRQRTALGGCDHVAGIEQHATVISLVPVMARTDEQLSPTT
ncbi:MAG: hypothetical protein ACI90G_001906 [Urechidicola sp.]|jgi:hypothetical protein